MNFDLNTAQVAGYSLFIGAFLTAVLLTMVFVLYQALSGHQDQEQSVRSLRQKEARTMRLDSVQKKKSKSTRYDEEAA